MRRKVSIETVDNGYVVRVLKQGVSVLKEEYEPPIKVFQNFDELTTYLGEFLLMPAKYIERGK